MKRDDDLLASISDSYDAVSGKIKEINAIIVSKKIDITKTEDKEFDRLWKMIMDVEKIQQSLMRIKDNIDKLSGAKHPEKEKEKEKERKDMNRNFFNQLVSHG